MKCIQLRFKVETLETDLFAALDYLITNTNVDKNIYEFVKYKFVYIFCFCFTFVLITVAKT